MARVPHLSLPFEWESYAGSLRAAEVEQDSIDEIAACVEAILRTPYGWRDERADFGRPELLFQISFSQEGLDRLVSRQEDRTGLLIDSDIDPIDLALRRIGVTVGED